MATKEPPKHYISVFSTSAVGTLIITLQGIQAISDIIVNLTGSVHPSGHPISRVFFPLAILGLVRLPAAPWLTSEYGYRQRKESEPLGEGVSEPLLLLPPNTDTNPIAARSNAPSNQFYPQNSWRGISTRVILMVVLLVLTALTVAFFALDFESDTRTSLTTFASQLFYLIFLVCTLAIVTSFIWRKEREEGNTTIIPCISSIWYQVYTYILFSLALVFILISALETRRTKCGLYTTEHIGWGRDDLICEAYQV
jgi:Ca2+/H+ antiporter